MVKMSDIFKKIEERKKEDKASQSPPVPATSPPATPISAHHETIFQPAPTVVEQKIDPPPVSQVKKDIDVAAFTECEKAYNDALALMQEIMRDDVIYELIDIHRITAIIDKLIDLSKTHPEKMTELALNPDMCTQASYIYCHMVNVCILSILLGLELHYEPYRLKEIGTAALLHDVGMVFYQSIINNPNKLTQDEFEKTKSHTILAAKVLNSIKGIDDITFVAARQHHERMDGSGYPDGLKGDQIHEYSRIVTILDIYEAMMHQRTYRAKFQARETIQEILKNKNYYDSRLIKILINRIGIFPIGSLVELNTKELARVVKINFDNILRPVVKIITNSSGEEAAAAEEKIVNLATEPALWIKHMEDKE